MTPQFSPLRISRFIYRDLVLLKRTIITALLVVSILMFLSFLLRLRGDHSISPTDFVNVFYKLYIPVGILFSFSIFKEVHSKKSNHFYTALPVSSFERITAIWFLTTVIYTLFFIVFTFLVGQLAVITASIFPETSFHIIPVGSERFWSAIKGYFFIQPIFLLGAIAFGKNRIGKTLLGIFLIVFVLWVINAIVFTMLNPGFNLFSNNPIVSKAYELASEDFSGIIQWFMLLIFSPMLLLAIYFKITEKEIY